MPSTCNGLLIVVVPLFLLEGFVSPASIFWIAIFVIVLRSMRPFSVSSKKRWRVFLFFDIRGKAPQNDTDATLVDSVSFLFLFG